MASRPIPKSAKRKPVDFAKPEKVPVGIVGLGLMGSSITTCLIAAGHPVTGTDTSETVRRTVRKRIRSHFVEMTTQGLLTKPPDTLLKRFRVFKDYRGFAGCELVIECAVEDLKAKKRIFRRLEKVIPVEGIIASNTSAIPITRLQEGAAHPERFLGVHWAEPAHITRFLEIICGRHSRLALAEKVYRMAHAWGKIPTLVRKDIRGFIANRMMYAMMREAFHLVDLGVASIEDVDRALRNDMGWWLTLAGAFRFMDLTGIPTYAAVMKDLFPELSKSDKLPALMKKVATSGARGVVNHKGFYEYTSGQAKSWEKLFLQFTYDIRRLADKYTEEAENISEPLKQ